ncbi:unnamed protein product [Ostreobium quekettii]|uniref:Knr4/Smi1-like domain-containing protein n=1 Tax=Ostreobium quekettii TaxID=121088 RepID=A0A8S1IS85_9CHLO|nr:unnamed protein product [Ostreobium quekettii]|eukprot:evm.model.scf_1542.2 EVM.evm.TU.scf_1542.2   scf_1542:26909-27478(+)
MDWPQLLEALEREPAGWEDEGDDRPQPGDPGGAGLRADPAPEAAIEGAERRLGTTLPQSYRQFLLHSNGFSCFAHGHHVLPVQEVKWFSEENQEWIDDFQGEGGGEDVADEQYFVYGDDQDPGHVRVEYLPHCLQISEEYDDSVILLNPKVKDAKGEWEAWFFASWLPGAHRYRSFRELVEEEARTRQE